jgi:hypothetical protein
MPSPTVRPAFSGGLAGRLVHWKIGRPSFASFADGAVDPGAQSERPEGQLPPPPLAPPPVLIGGQGRVAQESSGSGPPGAISDHGPLPLRDLLNPQLLAVASEGLHGADPEVLLRRLGLLRTELERRLRRVEAGPGPGGVARAPGQGP